MQYAIATSSSKLYASKESSIISVLFTLLENGTPHFKYFSLKLLTSIILVADGNDTMNLNTSLPFTRINTQKSALSSGTFVYSPLYSSIKNVFESQLVAEFNLKSRASSPIQNTSILDAYVDLDYISGAPSSKLISSKSPSKEEFSQNLVSSPEKKNESIKVFNSLFNLFFSS